MFFFSIFLVKMICLLLLFFFISSEITPCVISHVMVSIDVRTQPCVDVGEAPCSNHGICQETHRGMFFFSSCICHHGWRGWGCHDGQHAVGWPSLMSGICLLTVSNIFFLPAIFLAMKWKFYVQALLFTSTMVASILYHACDSEVSFIYYLRDSICFPKSINLT